MINNILRCVIYFIVFVLLQVLFFNNIHYLRIATPFLYLYCIIKLPVKMSRSGILIFSFLTGLVVDMFSNTPGLHSGACTLIALLREPLIHLLLGEEVVQGIYPSYNSFGYGGFIRYVSLFVIIHHTVLFMIEALSLFDPAFLILRIGASVIMTILSICTIELFNFEIQKVGE